MINYWEKYKEKRRIVNINFTIHRNRRGYVINILGSKINGVKRGISHAWQRNSLSNLFISPDFSTVWLRIQLLISQKVNYHFCQMFCVHHYGNLTNFSKLRVYWILKMTSYSTLIHSTWRYYVFIHICIALIPYNMYSLII